MIHKMERFAPELSFDLPATNLNLDAFSAFNLPQSLNASQSQSAQVALAEDFLRKFSDKIGRGLSNLGVSGDKGDNTLNVLRNQVVLNRSVTNASSDFLNDDWLRQAEYDKFMNEIWIGIVLTLIVISMVFCICSCFLYHQFRQWKNNYHRNVQQNADMESVKLSIGDDDLPSYTLVSGLPTYDAALQLFQKSSATNSCLLTYPSVFKIFASNEKLNTTQQHVSLPFYVNDPVSSSSSSIQPQNNDSLDTTPVPSYYDAVFGAHKIEKKDASGYHEALLSKNHTTSTQEDRLEINDFNNV